MMGILFCEKCDTALHACKCQDEEQTMSDNLKVAKECGAKIEEPLPAMHWVTFCDEELEAYTSRILASQQAAHEAEIAKLNMLVAALQEDKEIAEEQIATANAACAMKDEALDLSVNGTWIFGGTQRNADALDFLAAEYQDSAIHDHYIRLHEALTASQQQVSEWERKQLEPLRAQVAMLDDALKDAVNEYKKIPHSLGYTITHCQRWERMISNTQATAKKLIAECEQRGAVKALEEFMKRSGFGSMTANTMLNELRATSKKAG